MECSRHRFLRRLSWKPLDVIGTRLPCRHSEVHRSADTPRPIPERSNFRAPDPLRSRRASVGSSLRQETTCESARAIGDRAPRAIKDWSPVLSGTEIALKRLRLFALRLP